MDGSNVNRRHFLSMGAAAGLAAPAVSAAAPAQQAAGGTKFRLGFIGMGRQGRSNLRNALKQPEVEVVAFSEGPDRGSSEVDGVVDDRTDG